MSPRKASTTTTARWSKASTPGSTANRQGSWCSSSPSPLRGGPFPPTLSNRNRRRQRGHGGRLRAGDRRVRHLRRGGGGRGSSNGSRNRLRRRGRGSRRRAARHHDHTGSDLRAVKQVGDVLIQHADAARRHEFADRRWLVGAVDAVHGGTEIHGAGAERIANRKSTRLNSSH